MKLPVAARRALVQQVANHPGLAKLAAGLVPSQMSKRDLLATAKLLGIDVAALVKEIKSTVVGMEAIMEERPLKRLRHSEEFPAFDGTTYLDLTIRALDTEVTRRARISWECTPDWPHYDFVKKQITKGWPGMSFSLEVQAIPDGSGWPSKSEDIDPSRPYWTKLDLFDDGILPPEFYDRLRDAIDHDCREQDRKRRACYIEGSAAARSRREGSE